MSTKFLITGATSGLGGSVLSTLYNHLPPHERSSLIAASSRPDAAETLQDEYPGIQFRVLDYNSKKEQMVQALTGVDRFFFVSSPEFDSEKRERQHENVVKVAREAGVGYVYYASLAFGGYESSSKVGLQQAHLVTEKLLAQSGLRYTSIRMGVYTDAFPLFTTWYPNKKTIYQVTDGPVAWTSRAELGEATAQLMRRDPRTLSFPNNIALLTASRTYTLTDIVHAISRSTGQDITIKPVSKEDFPRVMVTEDAQEGRGKKSEAFFRGMLSLLDAVQQGEVKTVDPLMGELLGREPRDALRHVEELVREGAKEGGYTWHQNYDGR